MTSCLSVPLRVSATAGSQKWLCSLVISCFAPAAAASLLLEAAIAVEPVLPSDAASACGLLDMARMGSCRVTRTTVCMQGLGDA